ncbi:hypothetical protein Mal64_16880 [Pseudobythopirellula maris]|uniref:EF-hand domain-containing protein n=1 Tax=Pseudobythopirellula maris TaxID=2527991 RepID=A0A5C5ZLE0_9BACT|nr:hypothetical protein [Pseudobythopirellula maris]TWT88209.1 hypothetical protein Mal64_16880 [Pseudobythopirellula maris]
MPLRTIRTALCLALLLPAAAGATRIEFTAELQQADSGVDAPTMVSGVIEYRPESLAPYSPQVLGEMKYGKFDRFTLHLGNDEPLNLGEGFVTQTVENVYLFQAGQTGLDPSHEESNSYWVPSVLRLHPTIPAATSWTSIGNYGNFFTEEPDIFEASQLYSLNLDQALAALGSFSFAVSGVNPGQNQEDLLWALFDVIIADVANARSVINLLSDDEQIVLLPEMTELLENLAAFQVALGTNILGDGPLSWDTFSEEIGTLSQGLMTFDLLLSAVVIERQLSDDGGEGGDSINADRLAADFDGNPGVIRVLADIDGDGVIDRHEIVAILPDFGDIHPVYIVPPVSKPLVSLSFALETPEFDLGRFGLPADHELMLHYGVNGLGGPVEGTATYRITSLAIVPEPACAALLAAAIGLAAGVRRRR